MGTQARVDADVSGEIVSAMPLTYIRNKHLHLLIFMFAMLIFFPFAERYMKPELPFVTLLFLAGLTATLWALNLPKKTFAFCAMTAVSIFALELILKMLPQGACRMDISFVSWVLYAVFMIASIVLMVKKIFSSRYVTFDTIVGGINIYLLLAFLWAIVYHLINLADAGAFNIHGKMSTTQLLYYSYTTISTLGLGDILPVNRYTMIMSSLEAITGQLYVAIFVAMLVGMHISGRNSRKDA